MTSYGLTRRHVLVAAAGLAVVALAAYGASRAIRPDDFRAAFTGVDPLWVLASAAGYAVCQFTSAMVWFTGLRAAGLGRVGPGPTIGAHWIARGASEFVPLPVGEAVRLAALHRHPAARGAGAWRIAGSIGAYRVVDGGISLLIVTVLAVVMPLPPGVGAIRVVALLAVGAIVTVGLVAWRLGPDRLIPLVPQRMRPPLRQVRDGATLLASGHHIRAAVGWQAATAFARIVSLAALLEAFGMPASAALLVYCLTTLAAAIAISPGGLGVREAALVPALMAGYGLALEPALAFSLAVQALGLVVAVAGAGIALVALRVAIARDARRSTPESSATLDTATIDSGPPP